MMSHFKWATDFFCLESILELEPSCIGFLSMIVYVDAIENRSLDRLLIWFENQNIIAH